LSYTSEISSINKLVRQALWVTLAIPATHEAEIRRIQVWNQTRQKAVRFHSTKQLGVLTCTCHLSYTGGINRRTVSQASWAKIQDPVGKIKQKGLGRGSSDRLLA
jgi:hypothetical protein